MNPPFSVSPELTSSTDEPARPPSQRANVGRANVSRATIVAVALVAIGVAVVVATVLVPRAPVGPLADGDASPQATSATSTPNPTAAPTLVGTAGPLTPKAATSTLTALFTGFAAATQPGSSVDLTALASDAILDDFANEAQELKANGWVRTGAATVASVAVRSQNRGTGDVVVAACVDSTKVVTLDAAGTELVAPTPRALNLYTLSSTAGSWRVVARTFPDETTC